MAAMEYKGFMAAIEYDDELDSFMGTVLNVSSPITFYGQNPEELHREFANSVETWLEVCRERGIEPEKPYSGRMTIRLAPELHKHLALTAARSGKSLNAWVVDSLADLAQ